MAKIIIADKNVLFCESLCRFVKNEDPKNEVVCFSNVSDFKNGLTAINSHLVIASIDFIHAIAIPIFSDFMMCVVCDDLEKDMRSGVKYPCYFWQRGFSSRAIVRMMKDVFINSKHEISLSFIAPVQGVLKNGMDGFCLKKREAEVLGLLTQGLSNKGISKILDIEVVTVKFHVRAICKKLCVKNRTQAALLAQRDNAY